MLDLFTELQVLLSFYPFPVIFICKKQYQMHSSSFFELNTYIFIHAKFLLFPVIFTCKKQYVIRYVVKNVRCFPCSTPHSLHFRNQLTFIYAYFPISGMDILAQSFPRGLFKLVSRVETNFRCSPCCTQIIFASVSNIFTLSVVSLTQVDYPCSVSPFPVQFHMYRPQRDSSHCILPLCIV